VGIFATRLRNLRESKQLTLEDLANEINSQQGASLSKGMLSKWENSKGEASIQNAVKIAAYFGVSVDYLIGRDETEKGSAEEEPTRENIRFALSGEVRDLTEDELDEIVNFAKFVQERRKSKK